jgi:murein L,D-transpeptidase YcbB/YkuD
VTLDQPIRIIIAYSTAAARNGMVYFKHDIYNRDASVLKALDAPFMLRRQDG